jgi:hypothetical protein
VEFELPARHDEVNPSEPNFAFTSFTRKEVERSG